MSQEKLPKEKHREFFAFNLYPRISFDDQLKNEFVVLVLRRSFFTQVPWVANTFLFTFILIIINVIIPMFLSFQMILFLNIFCIVAIFSYVWLNFLIWYFNVGIITNMRLIDIDFNGILHKEFSQAELKQITDVTAKTIGFLPSFFNYGNVFVKTEGFQQNIEFLNVPQPNKVVEIINKLLRHPEQYAN
jgi:hypothetical protein